MDPVRRIGLSVVVTAVLVSWMGVPSTAWADENPLAETLEQAEIVATGEATPTDAEVPALRTQRTERGVVAFVELNATDLQVRVGNGTGGRASESGQYAIVAQSSSLSYAASFPEEGTTRLSAILAAPITSHPRWSFESGTKLLILDDGSVSISDGERFLGGIDAPWAVDSDGRSLPTHYEVSGATLTQIVDTTDATFPVVADPTIQFYGPYIQVHLNKTASIAAVGTYATCAAVLNKSPVWFAKALQIACGTVAAFSTAQLAGGQCVSIHYVVGVGGPAGVWWPWFRKC